METIEQMTKKAEVLYKKMQDWNSLQNEGASDGFNPHEDAYADAAEKLADAIFKDEWTLETTKARRQEWNDAVKAGKIKTHKDIADFEKLAGWKTSVLKSAVAKISASF